MPSLSAYCTLPHAYMRRPTSALQIHRHISSSLSTHSRKPIKSIKNITMASNTTFPPPELKQAAEDVAALLRERKETISVAETAAGGLISAALLSTPGASAFYKGGLTLYTLQSRIEFAGWTQENIDGYKGPTPDVVAGLATNVRARLGSTYCVSESGTAGPTGGTTRTRTPGYVALAVAGEQGTASKDLDTGHGKDREKNMVAFAVHALKFARAVIVGEAKI